MSNKLVTLKTTFLVITLTLLGQCLADIAQMPESMRNGFKTPIEYSVYNEVSIVHNTQLDFEEFWTSLEKLEQSNTSKSATGQGNLHKRAVVREALVTYIWPKIIIDPIYPGNPHLYDSAYEHAKQVFGHKFIKDFIIRAKKDVFTKEEIEAWF